MKILETAKFVRLRKKIREEHELESLHTAVQAVFLNPGAGKSLKGEFKDLRSYRYSSNGQSRRLIYKVEKDAIILLSFGPRESVYR
jgi:mRNA-degrading endonuclease RelE of RelBE toxin-antitoxin system